MAKRRIQIDLVLDSEATADNLISFIQTRLATYDVFSIDSLQKIIPSPMGDNRWHLFAHIRTNITANCSDLRDRIRDRATTGILANKILTGSKVTLHTCPHEQPEKEWYSCIEDEIWVK